MKTPDHLRWSAAAPADGEPAFVAKLASEAGDRPLHLRRVKNVRYMHDHRENNEVAEFSVLEQGALSFVRAHPKVARWNRLLKMTSVAAGFAAVRAQTTEQPTSEARLDVVEVKRK